MSTEASAFLFGVLTEIGSSGLFGTSRLSVGSSSQIILPCFEHSTHTVSLAPSIMALMGLLWILRPQTSHRNGFSPRLSLLYACVYSCRNKKCRTLMKPFGKRFEKN